MKRAPDGERKRECKRCAKTFFVKPCKRGTYCSMACRVAANASPAKVPRACEVCGTIFTPKYYRSIAKHCSRTCTWIATKGPTYNAIIARESVMARSDAQRGRGEGKTYRKLHGRHEHRVVAEGIIGASVGARRDRASQGRKQT